MSRIPEISREELDAAGRKTYDEILAARGSIAGPLKVNTPSGTSASITIFRSSR
jgi:hypothetical protein